MKKGLLIVVGIFIFTFILISFVSANYCTGTMPCYTLGGNSCSSVNGCYWYSYGATTCSTSDDCVGYCSGGKCKCYYDGMCASGEFCNQTSGNCESGWCSGSSGLCSSFDHNQDGCAQYPSYCTWETGCLLDSDCGTYQNCAGEGGYCSGNYIDTSAPIFPLDSYASYYYGGGTANKLLWNFNETCNWKVETYYYDCMLLNGGWSCQDCGGCGSQLDSVGLVVHDGGWYKAYCNGNYNWLGFCTSSSWVAGTTYADRISSAYDTKSCSGFSKGSCTGTCSWVNTYGTCEDTIYVCGNGIVEHGETCDDRNINNNDGCSSTCQTETGFTCNGASPTCCYNSGFTWLKNEVPFNSGGDIKEGDILSMVYNDDFCYGTGSVYGYLYKGITPLVSNMYTRIVGGTPGSTRANYTVTSSFISTLGLGVSSTIFFKADFIPINSPSIPVVPRSCGDGVCSSSVGESCLNCAADCGCTSPQTCNSVGQCILPTVYCGNGKCDGGETCSSCSQDCSCDDSDVCTTDGCSSGTCTHTTINCNDNDLCSTDICAGGCQHPSVSCPDDYNACTTNWCSPSAGCTYTLISSCSLISDGCCLSQCNIGNDADCTARCGDGIKSTGEQCDGSDLNGASNCASHYSSEPGWTGTPTCNLDCTLNYASPPCVAPPVCSITSATWNTAEIIEGKSVKLNIQTTHCTDGQSVSFVIKEDNHGALFNPDRTSKNTPSNAFITSNSATGTWTAEWIDDSVGSETNPPEYYFTATIVGSSPARSLRSTTPHPELNVTQTLDVVCSGISSCSNYLTQSNCEKDLCTVGENEVPSTVTCGGRFNSNTGCFDSTNCGCSWISGVCKPSWTSTSSCGTCGNYIRDFGEECDDGNLINGDGCSSTCKFESYIDPCPIGLTLCSDGTCSLNCEVTDTTVAACDYDHSCETGEGCTCSDCNGYIDTCEADLTCNIFDKACCNPSSDGICSPYCAYVDPDCLTGTCGNGVEEKGEECDLGIRNSNIIESGCNSDCTLQDNIIPGLDGCPEGTNLCSDGTCSLNCFATDAGIAGCDIPGTCAEGLVCSAEDQACCNEASDGFCDEYCAFVDPDCVSTGTGENVVGTCSYTEIGTDTCEDDHMLTRHLAHAWTWAVDNLLYSDPLGKEAECVDIEDTLVCPASVEVPFFGIYEFAIAVVVIGLIYLIYELRKKNNSKKKKRK